MSVDFFRINYPGYVALEITLNSPDDLDRKSTRLNSSHT